MPLPQYESKRHPHRTDFYKVEDLAHRIAGDVVLVPDPSNLDGLTRDALTKISHWSNMDPSDVPRLAVLTDSFFRFIDEGQDASVLTLWRDGTPIIQQIDGEPCEAAVDAVMDAVTDMKPLQEKWVGLQPLEAEIERLAYQKGFAAGHRPNWLERVARRRLEARDIDPDEDQGDATEEPPAPEADQPQADNDNLRPEQLERLHRIQADHGGEIRGKTLFGTKFDGKAGQVFFREDGKPWFQDSTGSLFPVTDRKPIHATPFRLRNPASLPTRDWLFGRHYIRKYLTATIGAGGGGKSAHSVSEVLAMVTGRPLLDPDGPLTPKLRVWYVNAEDPQDEIDRRFHAAAKHFGVTAELIADRLYTDSGRDQEFVIMRQVGRELVLCEPVIEEMVAEIHRRQIDVVIIDPFVSTHEAPENDNTAMQRVGKAWTMVADKANCSVEVIHHVVKGAAEVTADSGRGGGALKDKTRGMRVLNPMTAAEATKVGLDGPDGYFRLDHGKVNLVASGRSQWRRFVSVPLGNGRGLVKTGDEIGVVESWRWPSKGALEERAAEQRRAVVADVPADFLAGLKVRLEHSDYKESPQASNWAGKLVAELFGFDAKIDRDQIKAMLAAWIDAGELQIVDLPDAYRHMKPHVKPTAAP